MNPNDDPDPSDGYDDEQVPTPDDTPRGVNAYGTTPREESSGEPLDVKLEREQSDVGERTGWGTAPDGPGEGRLVQPDEGAHSDREKDEVATMADDASDLSAEEQAVHVTPEP